MQLLGAARLGMTQPELATREGRAWLRYRPSTLVLWLATIATRAGVTALAAATGATLAAGGPALLLSVGTTLLAEAAVIAHRATNQSRPPTQAPSPV